MVIEILVMVGYIFWWIVVVVLGGFESVLVGVFFWESDVGICVIVMEGYGMVR